MWKTTDLEPCKTETCDLSTTALAEVRELADAGDEALAKHFDLHRDELLKSIRKKLPSVIEGRLDASDIVQETYLEAQRRLPEYVKSPRIPIFNWLRRIGLQTLSQFRRHHQVSQKRSTKKEVGRGNEAWFRALGQQLAGSISSPSLVASRKETEERVTLLLRQLSENDQEILKLKHMDDMSLSAAARHIGIDLEAAKKRYRRALKRLSGLIEQGGP